MLKLIKKYKKILIIVSFAYIYIVTLLLAPSGFLALTPGEITTTKESYLINNVEFQNDINTVSVYNWHNLTVFQKWITDKSSSIDTYKQTQSLSDSKLQGQISHNSSNDNAIITAYKYANKIDSNISIDYTLDSLTIYETSNNELRINDQIIEINNETITSNSYEEFLKKANVFNETNSRYIYENKETKLKIIRDNNELIITLKDKELVVFYPKYTIKKTNPSFDGFVSRGDVGGPSGGMIQTLSIYYALTNQKIEGRITGTGTIEMDDSNEIGRIGGLVQKYYTVKKAKAKYFIIPKSQSKVELDKINELNKNNGIIIIVVENFEDVIRGLENYV